MRFTDVGSPQQAFPDIEAKGVLMEPPGPLGEAVWEPLAEGCGKAARTATECLRECASPKVEVGWRQGRRSARPLVLVNRGWVDLRASPCPGHDVTALDVADVGQGSDLQELTNCREAVEIVTAKPGGNKGRKKKGVADSIWQKKREVVMDEDSVEC